MSFAAALSEHPVAATATGEVAGAVLEAIGQRPDLVVVTVTRPHAGALEDIARAVAAVLGPLVLVGGAAESVVGTGHEIDRRPAVSLWAGRVGPLAAVRLQGTRLADGTWHFTGWPGPMGFRPRALLLVADPFTFPTDRFLAWLHRRAPDLPVIGGAVSGGRGPGGSRLVVGDRVVTDGAVGVLVGAGVDIETVVSQGGRAYGRALTVTRGHGNLVYEVAGVPALTCLADQIRSAPAVAATREAVGEVGLCLGRLIDERVGDPGPGDYLVRAVVGMDRATGAVAVEDRVPLGSTVRFHRRDAVTAHLELVTLLAGHRAQGALLFSGHDRGTRLFEQAHHDARVLEDALGPVPVGGLLGAAQIGPVGGGNFVHTSTASMALFRDR